MNVGGAVVARPLGIGRAYANSVPSAKLAWALHMQEACQVQTNVDRPMEGVNGAEILRFEVLETTSDGFRDCFTTAPSFRDSRIPRQVLGTTRSGFRDSVKSVGRKKAALHALKYPPRALLCERDELLSCYPEVLRGAGLGR